MMHDTNVTGHICARAAEPTDASVLQDGILQDTCSHNTHLEDRGRFFLFLSLSRDRNIAAVVICAGAYMYAEFIRLGYQISLISASETGDRSRH